MWARMQGERSRKAPRPLHLQPLRRELVAGGEVELGHGLDGVVGQRRHERCVQVVRAVEVEAEAGQIRAQRQHCQVRVAHLDEGQQAEQAEAVGLANIAAAAGLEPPAAAPHAHGALLLQPHERLVLGPARLPRAGQVREGVPAARQPKARRPCAAGGARLQPPEPVPRCGRPRQGREVL